MGLACKVYLILSLPSGHDVVVVCSRAHGSLLASIAGTPRSKFPVQLDLASSIYKAACPFLKILPFQGLTSRRVRSEKTKDRCWFPNTKLQNYKGIVLGTVPTKASWAGPHEVILALRFLPPADSERRYEAALDHITAMQVAVSSLKAVGLMNDRCPLDEHHPTNTNVSRISPAGWISYLSFFGTRTAPADVRLRVDAVFQD